MEKLSELVSQVRANNPGPMTLTGTNTYLVGRGSEVAVIDPGPKMEEHLQQLVTLVHEQNRHIIAILVTHGHPDHYPGAARLKELCGAPVAAYRDATFPHDIKLEDEQRYHVAGVNFICHFTPGHASDHLCYYLEEEDALFTGDNVLGTGTTIVAPPKGNMRQYLDSLDLLQTRCRNTRVIYGGHGPAITNPPAKLAEYVAHRQMRLQQVLEALQAGAQTIPQVVEHVYQDTDRRLWPAAARQVLAQLDYLEEQGKVVRGDTRPLTPEEDLILNPEGIVDPVALAELGITGKSEPLRIYRLL
jgi:glyoxylase-like metal-dependent hydrolase (beta-lactamase superfamily II)